jgi:D-cysteine desulfhydrase
VLPPQSDTSFSERLGAVPSTSLAQYPTPIEELGRLREALGAAPRLWIKRDDTIGFAFGGNKVRKAELVLAAAMREGVDTVITMGALQSNHARVTAAAAARMGIECHLVLNGSVPDRHTGNTLLDLMLGAHLHIVSSREERVSAMTATAEALRARGRKVYEIPVGASTPIGALGYVRAVGEMRSQMPPPDFIVHASSSGGTQAGLTAGCVLFAVPARILGVSADDPADTLRLQVQSIVAGIEPILGMTAGSLTRGTSIEVDDRFVGEGYGIPTPASRRAIDLLARTEAIFLDPTYTAKAMAALIHYVEAGRFGPDQSVLFWHTGGQVALLA